MYVFDGKNLISIFGIPYFPVLLKTGDRSGSSLHNPCLYPKREHPDSAGAVAMLIGILRKQAQRDLFLLSLGKYNVRCLQMFHVLLSCPIRNGVQTGLGLGREKGLPHWSLVVNMCVKSRVSHGIHSGERSVTKWHVWGGAK